LKRLFQRGYSWLNVSCYGVHNDFLIVAVEVPSETVSVMTTSGWSQAELCLELLHSVLEYQPIPASGIWGELLAIAKSPGGAMSRRYLLLTCIVFTFLVVVQAPAVESRTKDFIPAGTILHCTMDEPNFSAKTANVGDRSGTLFSREARNSEAISRITRIPATSSAKDGWRLNLTG
jgi:hypothetical protein